MLGSMDNWGLQSRYLPDALCQSYTQLIELIWACSYSGPLTRPNEDVLADLGEQL